MGTVVGRTSRGSLILTTAHCLSIGGLRVATKSAPSSAVVTQTAHPKFNPGSQEASFDLAIVEAGDAFDDAPFVPLTPDTTQVDAGQTLTFWVEGKLQRASAVRVTATTFTFSASGRSLCTGASGTPIFVGDSGAYQLAGVVSRGNSTCGQGEIEVARTNAAAALLPSADNSLERLHGKHVRFVWKAIATRRKRVGASSHGAARIVVQRLAALYGGMLRSNL